MKHHIVLDVVPVTWKRHDKYGRNNPKYNEFKKLVQDLLAIWNVEHNRPIDPKTNIRLSLKICGKGLRGDVDNYAKAIMDSLQGVIIENDRQVKHLTVELASGEPQIEIVIEEIKV